MSNGYRRNSEDYNYYLTNAQRLAGTFASGDTVFEIDTENGYRKNASGWTQIESGGANLVGVSFTGSVGQTHNRNIAAANTTYNTSTNTATWTDAEGVTDLVIHCVAATAAAIQNDEACLIVFNAPDATVAAAWLGAAGGAATDVEYGVAWVGVPYERSFTDPVTRIDVLPLNVNMRVIVEAN